MSRVMRVGVYRDLFAIRFIRCVAPVSGVPINAGGAGFTLQQALARCESEAVERAFEYFELSAMMGVRPVGIAAHLDYEHAKERALQEAIETLCLQQIHAELKIRCLFTIKLPRHTIGVTRTNQGYFAMMTGFLENEPVAAYSADRHLFPALLKMWEEYRNLQFFKPSGTKLKTYTKAQKLFSATELKSLAFQFEPKAIYRPDFSELAEGSAERSGRVIVYYIKKEPK